MDESEFNRRAEEMLGRIELALEAEDLDFEFQPGGVLEVEFADGGRLVINRHVANREIWVAGRFGAHHFAWDGSGWRDTRDGEEAMQRLSRLLSEQAGKAIRLA